MQFHWVLTVNHPTEKKGRAPYEKFIQSSQVGEKGNQEDNLEHKQLPKNTIKKILPQKNTTTEQERHTIRLFEVPTVVNSMSLPLAQFALLSAFLVRI